VGQPLIAATFPIPKIALLPLLILWLGIGEPSKVAVIALGVFFPMAINTSAGVREADPLLVRAAVAFGAGRWSVIRKVVLPSALPMIFAGMGVALALADAGPAVGRAYAWNMGGSALGCLLYVPALRALGGEGTVLLACALALAAAALFRIGAAGRPPWLAVAAALAALALAVGAPHEAEQVLEVLAGHDTGQVHYRKVRLLLAEALVHQSKAHRALSVIQELDDTGALPANQLAEMTGLRATAEYLMAKDDAGYAGTAEKSLHAATTAGDIRLVTQALLEFARSGVETGNVTRVRDALSQMDAAGMNPAPADLPIVHYTRAYCLFHLRQVAEAARALRLALELGSANRNVVERSKTLTALAICQHLMCDTGAALATGCDALEMAKRVGDYSRCSVITGNLASIHLVRGEYHEAIARADESLKLALESLIQPFLLSTFTTKAFAHALLGDHKASEESFAEGARWAGGVPRWRIRLQYALEAAEFELMKGNLSAALGRFQDAEALHPDVLVPFESHYQPLRMLWLWHARDAGEAMTFIREQVQDLQDRIPLTFLTAATGLAWLELATGGPQSAESAAAMVDPRWGAIPGRRALLGAEGFVISAMALRKD